MNKWLWSLLCVVLLGAAACSDDDTEDASKTPQTPTIATENLPDAGLKFLYSAQTVHTFLMSVDAPWEITKTAGWFVVTPIKGEAGKDIPVTVTAVQNEGDARDGTFTIRANSGNNLHPCLAEKSVTLAQDAYLAAGIVITGLEERTLIFEAEEPAPATFTVNASYDWTIDVTNETWLSVAPKSGKAGAETQVTITPKASTENERHESTLTITAGDPGFGENTATEVIELVQTPYMPSDSHAEGYVFFSDDFAWITQNWVSPYTKYGWPSVSIDGTNGNEFALSTDGMKEVVAAKGYTCTASTYARYEGHVKLGKTANMGAITIPALAGIDAGKAATLLVQFDAAAYSSAGGAVDDGDDKIDVSITGPGTINGLLETTTLVEVKNVWSWTRYSVIVYGATAQTRITFGSERKVKCRLYIDNISVTRAKDEELTAPEPEAIVTPLDKEITNTTPAALFNASGEVIPDGGTLTASIRVNKAWTARTDCDWLTITTVRCGDKTPETVTGPNNGASLADGVATVKATGLPYVTTKVEVAKHTGSESRTGHIIVESEGQQIEKIAITQASGLLISIGGLTDNAMEIGDNPNAADGEVRFTIRAPYPWTIEIPEAETWYTVSPMQGAADTDVEVIAKAAVQNPGMRRFGSFTITSTPAGAGDPLTQAISVEQLPAAIGAVKWDKTQPVQWSFSADDMHKYLKDFNGKAADTGSRNALPAEQGPGYISYVHTYPGLPAECERIVGGTGHPYVTGAWPGDYWLFTVPVASLDAGTKVQFKALTRTSAQGQLYWKMEYNDGGAWKPVIALTTETVNGEEVSYTHKVLSSNITVNFTVTYANAITDGEIEFRMTCMANWRTNGSGPLEKPNTGTFRWAGAGAADSPRIQIVP